MAAAGCCFLLLLWLPPQSVFTPTLISTPGLQFLWKSKSTIQHTFQAPVETLSHDLYSIFAPCLTAIGPSTVRARCCFCFSEIVHAALYLQVDDDDGRTDGTDGQRTTTTGRATDGRRTGQRTTTTTEQTTKDDDGRTAYIPFSYHIHITHIP